MSRRIAIIDGHPDKDPARLCHALADAYARGAEDAGHDVTRIDLARLEFPILRSRTEFEEGEVPAEIAKAQDSLASADHIVIIYPLWLGTMPALLKAFLEQVFRPGFALEFVNEGWPKKLLRGKSARIVVTMGMPGFVYRWFYLAHSLRSLERNILKFAGIAPLRETILGLVEQASEAKRARWLASMAELGSKGV